MDAYQGDLAFLESPGPAVDPNGGHFVHLRCHRQGPGTLRHASHSDSLIIAVSGASANGPNRSAVGIYFGPNNPFNLSLAVPTKHYTWEGGEKLRWPHTTHRAEPYAVLAALYAVLPFLHPAQCTAYDNIPTTVMQIIIKIDSGYIVDNTQLPSACPRASNSVGTAGYIQCNCL
ncbi:Ribonuclease H1 [Colletotrichum asianum]|uniref:Uncharacterized protein n=1 Tax=Colletotrichum asianum TaxID=702518 RepID=A0A8H3ZN84_9PEZI|nr:hypothetical protein GQ607_011028 [Colletotrichum asianum]